MELFDNTSNTNVVLPLAEKIRPVSFEEVIGQKNVVKALKGFVKSGKVPSLIFWGPPGSGKTTMALILASQLDYHIEKISAVESGIKDIRRVIEIADRNFRLNKRTLLFIDEIHRFNKSQQDALLHAVESGKLTLIGATTENPSFEVNSALISRVQVYRLEHLTDIEIENVLKRVIGKDNELASKIEDIKVLEPIIRISGGDARTAIKFFELVFSSANELKRDINLDLIQEVLDKKIPGYDKTGDNHYDTISAFIKSMRGSDPDAAVFWLARMLEAGEDPKFIARRMVIFASEDIGNAEPFAITLAVSCFQAVNLIGMPECRINLSQTVIYLASAPKSNASYIAIDSAYADLRKGVDTSVPLHLRNAPTKLMKEESYGKDYKYPHDFEGGFVKENYFPDKFPKKQYYKPTLNGREAKISEQLKKLWLG